MAIATEPLQVHAWPPERPLSVSTVSNSLPLVLSVATPDTPLRDRARRLARDALREALIEVFDCSPGKVELLSIPGEPVRLAGTYSHIGLSISHEPGLSVIAIHSAGKVGIDLMRIDDAGPPDDRLAVARDYLGSDVVARLRNLPAHRHGMEFAQEWTRLEAALKCHGLPLQEWTPDNAQKVAQCRLHRLVVPAGFAGSVATL